MTVIEEAPPLLISDVLPFARPEDSWVIDKILNKGGYRKGLQIQPGDVLLDLGAHVGACAAFALQQGAEHVIAVEMLPDTVSVLRRHFATDPRVTIIPAAVVGPGRGTVVETRRFSNPMGASVSNFNATARPDKRITVPTVTLAGLLHGYDPTKLKLDIENAEYEVLDEDGIQALWLSRVERVAAELHISNTATVAAAIRLLHQMQLAGWTSNRDSYVIEKPSSWHLAVHWWRA